MNSDPSPAELYARRIRHLVEDYDFGGRVLNLVADLWGPNAIFNAWREFRDWDRGKDEETPLKLGSDSPFAKLFISWLAHSWRLVEDRDGEIDPDLVGCAPTEVFLDRHPGLSSLLYRFLETCTYSPFSFYEVLHCKRGRSLHFRDLIIAREHEIFDETAAQILKPGSMVYARVVEMDGLALLEALAPITFSGAHIQPIIDCRNALLDGAPPPIEIGLARQLLVDREPELRRAFWDLVSRSDLRPALDPCLGVGIKPRLH